MKDQQVPLWALLVTAFAAAVFPFFTSVVNNWYQLRIADRKLRNEHSATLSADKRAIFKRVSAWLIEAEYLVRWLDPNEQPSGRTTSGLLSEMREAQERQAIKAAQFKMLGSVSDDASSLIGEVSLYSQSIGLQMGKYSDHYETILHVWWPESGLKNHLPHVPINILRLKMTDCRLQILEAMADDIQRVSEVKN